jgi:predicted acylesterase/phospholipase RssA
MGSVMSANIAMGRNEAEIVEVQRQSVARKPFKRYTFPIMSLIEAAPIDGVARMSFGDVQIEDLWLPYFCVSADLTAARPLVHRNGALWKATRASGALPVITMPVLHEGHLLVDGGLFNNLPGDVMRELGVGYVIAVNVSPDDELHVDLKELPTNRELFWKRWFGRSKAPALPGLGDILVRTMVLSSQQKLEEVTATADLLLKVPVEPYGMLQFEAIDELIKLGYDFTLEQLAQGAGKELPRGI